MYSGISSIFLIWMLVAIVDTAYLERMRRAETKTGLDDQSSLERYLGLGETEWLEAVSEFKTVNGTKVKFRHVYRGIKVYGASVVAGKLDGKSYNGWAYGNLARKIHENLNLSEYDAMDWQFSEKGLEESMTACFIHNSHNVSPYDNYRRNEKAELFIYVGKPSEPSEVSARLMYLVSYLVEMTTPSGEYVSRPMCKVDAKTQEVLQSWEGLATAAIRTSREAVDVHTAAGGNPKAGVHKFDGILLPKLSAITTVEGANCKYSSTKVISINMKEGVENGEVYSAKCSDESTSKKINGNPGVFNDAQYYGGVAVDALTDIFGKNPFRGPVKLRVHYGKRYENAFWDGETATFGDGGNRLYPLVGLNVIGHELTHGLTEKHSGLESHGQSGAISEAISDMAGEAIEYYHHKENDFLVGSEVYKQRGAAVRYMCQPERDGKSISHAKDYYPTMHLHKASGVLNKAFCLLAKSTGFSAKLAFRIFAQANQNYFGPMTTFGDCACDVENAAADEGVDLTVVKHALQSVGLCCGCTGVNGLPNSGNGVSQHMHFDYPTSANIDANSQESDQNGASKSLFVDRDQTPYGSQHKKESFDPSPVNTKPDPSGSDKNEPVKPSPIHTTPDPSRSHKKEQWVKPHPSGSDQNPEPANPTSVNTNPNPSESDKNVPVKPLPGNTNTYPPGSDKKEQWVKPHLSGSDQNPEPVNPTSVNTNPNPSDSDKNIPVKPLPGNTNTYPPGSDKKEQWVKPHLSGSDQNPDHVNPQTVNTSPYPTGSDQNVPVKLPPGNTNTYPSGSDKKEQWVKLYSSGSEKNPEPVNPPSLNTNPYPAGSGQNVSVKPPPENTNPYRPESVQYEQWVRPYPSGSDQNPDPASSPLVNTPNPSGSDRNVPVKPMSVNTSPYPPVSDKKEQRVKPYPSGSDQNPEPVNPLPVNTKPHPSGSDQSETNKPLPVNTKPYPSGADQNPEPAYPPPVNTNPYPSGSDQNEQWGESTSGLFDFRAPHPNQAGQSAADSETPTGKSENGRSNTNQSPSDKSKPTVPDSFKAGDLFSVDGGQTDNAAAQSRDLMSFASGVFNQVKFPSSNDGKRTPSGNGKSNDTGKVASNSD